MWHNGIRYTRQRRKRDCSVTALVNAIKWLGHKTSYSQNFSYYSKICKYDPEQGTSIKIFKKIFRRLQMFNKKRIINNINDLQLKNHLLKGGAAIFTFQLGLGFHTAFISGIDNKKYVIINLDDLSPTIRFLTENKMNQLLLRKNLVFLFNK